MAVLSVEKPLAKCVVSRNTRRSILEKSHISALLVGRVSVGNHISPPIRSHTQEKSPITVQSEGRSLVTCLLSRYTKGSIQGKSRISVLSVENL